MPLARDHVTLRAFSPQESNAPAVRRGQHGALATGDAEAFPGWSAACSLSAICQHTSLATPCAPGRRLDPPVLTSWDDVVRSMAVKGSVRRPHSLHTAEVVGSNPTTPTRRPR